MCIKLRGALGIVALLLARLAFAVDSEATDPESIVRAHITAQNAHDVAAIIDTLADYVLVSERRPDGSWSRPTKTNKKKQRSNYERAVSYAPDSRWEIVSMFTSGSYVVTRESVTGIPGVPYAEGIAIYKIANGKIVALWVMETDASAN